MRWNWSSAARLDLRDGGGGLTLRRERGLAQGVDGGVSVQHGLKRERWGGGCRQRRRVHGRNGSGPDAGAAICWRTCSKDDILDGPYAHFTRSNMVPADVYAALEAEFPSLDHDPQRPHRRQQSGRAHDGEAGAERPAHLAAVARVLRVSYLEATTGATSCACSATISAAPSRVSRSGSGAATKIGASCRAASPARPISISIASSSMNTPVDRGQQREARACRSLRQDLQRAVLLPRCRGQQRRRRFRDLSLAPQPALHQASQHGPRRGDGEDRQVRGQCLCLLPQLGAGGARREPARHHRHSAPLHQLHRRIADQGVRAEAAHRLAEALVCQRREGRVQDEALSSPACTRLRRHSTGARSFRCAFSMHRIQNVRPA